MLEKGEILLEQMKNIDRRLQTINDLLQLGDMIRLAPDKLTQVSGAVVHTIIDEADYQVGIAQYAHIGDATEEHKHDNITQFVIQARGRCGAFFSNGGYRILEPAECCVLKPGELHKFVALANDSIQVWICIPAEPGYRISSAQQ